MTRSGGGSRICDRDHRRRGPDLSSDLSLTGGTTLGTRRARKLSTPGICIAAPTDVTGTTRTTTGAATRTPISAASPLPVRPPIINGTLASSPGADEARIRFATSAVLILRPLLSTTTRSERMS